MAYQNLGTLPTRVALAVKEVHTKLNRAKVNAYLYLLVDFIVVVRRFLHVCYVSLACDRARV